MKHEELTALQKVVLGKLPSVVFRRRPDHIVIFNHAPQLWTLVQTLIIPTDTTIREGDALKEQQRWLLGLGHDLGWEMRDIGAEILGVSRKEVGTKLMMNDGRGGGQLDELPHVHVFVGRGNIYIEQFAPKPPVMPMDERTRRAAPWIERRAA